MKTEPFVIINIHHCEKKSATDANFLRPSPLS